MCARKKSWVYNFAVRKLSGRLSKVVKSLSPTCFKAPIACKKQWQKVHLPIRSSYARWLRFCFASTWFLYRLFIVGLPVAPNYGMGFLRQKKTKWRTVHPEGVACLNPSSTEPIFAGREPVISGRLGNRFRNRFGTNIKLFRGVIAPNIYAEWLSKCNIRCCY